jgi:biotin carboxyl carrier protein
MKYQVHINDKVVDLEIKNHQPHLKVFHEEKPINFDFQKLHSNLYSLILEGKQHRVWLESLENGDYKIFINHHSFKAVVEDERQRLRKAFRSTQTGKSGVIQVHAPMPGLVTQVGVEPNQSVNSGQGLLIIEAMKMENEIKSPREGKILKIFVKQGDAIEKGILLLEIHK